MLKRIKKVDYNTIPKVYYSIEEVSRHNKENDCWMIIKGKIYDVTNYFPFHPGGTKALLKFAGKDATENVEYHSAQMMKLLNTYFYIGKLEGNEERCIIS